MELFQLLVVSKHVFTLTNSGRVAAIRVSSLLFDRWETIRVRLATRQNIIEIQILEDEQYKRMVEGYKSEQTSPVVSFT